MDVTGATVAYLVIVFSLGIAATFYPALAIAAIALCVLAVVVWTRFRVFNFRGLDVIGTVRPDWIIVLLPTVIAVRPFSERGFFLAIGLLVAAAFLRKPTKGKFGIQPGPVLFLFAASSIVFIRPSDTGSVLTFILVGALAIRLVMTVGAPRIISSMVDGCGLYLALNVIAYAAGLRSPAAGSRIGALVESTGFTRIIFPLASTLNTPPTIASIYVVAFIFMIWEAGWVRRTLRLACLAAAMVVLVSAGTRVPMIAVAVISLIVICLPMATRWLAQATAILAAASVFVLPTVITVTQFLVAPVLSLIPGRDLGIGTIATLNGRDTIWERSISYWNDWVSDPLNVWFGFGVNGQYRSGASLGYRDFISSITRSPELASVHNSFLQQLYDGGIVGVLLLFVAVFWASARLAKRRRAWGNWGLIAIAAMSLLLLSGMTEVSAVPGPAQGTFWLLVILVAVACQADERQAGTDTPNARPVDAQLSILRSPSIPAGTFSVANGTN